MDKSFAIWTLDRMMGLHICIQFWIWVWVDTNRKVSKAAGFSMNTSKLTARTWSCLE
jgi:hypothetical protein